MTAYAEPPVVVTGQTMSAANWNAWVVNVAKAMWVYTTAGDMAYATNGTNLTRLPVGGTGKQLGIVSGLPAWVDGVPGLFTAAGDLVYGTGADAAGVLHKPAVQDSLLAMSSSGTPSWKALSDTLPGTTAGDMDYYTAAQVKGRLGKPSATSLLQMGSAGTPSWKLLSQVLPGTTAGDVDYYTGSGVKARLGKPSLPSLLAMDSAGVPAWLEVGAVRGQSVVVTDMAWTNSGWMGSAKSVGQYTYYINSFTGSVPNTAKAIIVSVSVKWAASGDGNFLAISPYGGYGYCMVARALQANFSIDHEGIVPLANDGRLTIEIGGANVSSVYIWIWGYLSG